MTLYSKFLVVSQSEETIYIFTGVSPLFASKLLNSCLDKRKMHVSESLHILFLECERERFNDRSCMELYRKPLKRDWVARAVFSRACFSRARL